ncbi:MAG: hypothetical protein HOP15_15595 [Planctomycetes bacterium]|nr:hypothetical protein [Planctomycetota bacterium]
MTRRRHEAPQLFLALAAALLGATLLAAGCGAGTAGIVSSSGNGGGSNSSPSIANLEVPVSRTAPGRIHVELSDREGQSVQLELSARVPLVGGGLSDAETLTEVSGPGFPSNGSSVAIPSGNQALALELEWHFPDEAFPDWPDDGRFVEGVQLVARLSSGAQSVLGDDEPLSLGNDAPEVTAATPIIDPDEGEAAGIVRVEVSVEDSSDDVVTVVPEFDIQGDAPDAGWQPATGFGLDNVRVARTGTQLDFFWDTDTDLHDLERVVALRFTATDFALEGEALASGPFRVDNNAAPIVQLFNDAVLANPDERRGIPVPFRVIDEEGDVVETIFQWRREGEEFPELPTDMAALDAILAHPVRRQEKHVCTPYPHYAKGRVVPIDENTVRLPELASSESWILASGIEGRTLELLRPSSIPAPITPTWSSNPLVSPIVALPVGDGLTALVLDIPANGRLREIELATGAVVREIAMLGAAIPSAMAIERGEKAMLVALDDAGTWRIERVELESGVQTELMVSDGTEPAPVRGVASLGTNALVFTAGSSLFHLDYRDPLAPQIGKLLTDLAAPWGLVVDPLQPHRIHLGERDANRVLAIELDSYAELPVVVKTADMQLGTLEAPEALALERSGSRMLVVTSAPGGGRQLLGLDLGATGGNRAFPIGEPTATDVVSVAAGPDGLRLLCLPGSNELLAAGGIEQRRVIAAHSTSSQDVSVEQPFDPVPSPGQPWRLAEEAHRLLRASAQGVAGRFVWDSADAFTGLISLRAVAQGDELGLAVDAGAPKRVRGELEVDALTLGGDTITQRPRKVAVADLDGDGDLDLVSANRDGDNLTVFFQSSGSFATAPSLTLGGSLTTNAPFSVAAADLDGDGDLDLVSANNAGHDLAVFFQLSPGTFAQPPLRLGGLGRTNGPTSVAPADLDGDGDLDLVSANVGGNLTVFFQGAPGSFAAAPLTLGDSATTNWPISVAAADLDGDGDLDLASANQVGDNLTVFFQTSPGSFAAAPLTLGDSATTDGPTTVAAADLDGDGDLDLVSANRDGNDLTVFFQLAPGSFEATPSLTLGRLPLPQRPLSVAAADLDGDGDLDLVSANIDGDNLTVFFQLAPGSFATTPLVLGDPVTTFSPASVAAADLDGDGDLDLVSANEINGNTLAVFFQASPGSFGGAPLVLGDTAVTRRPASVAASDLDGDGDLDLVMANQVDDNLALFHQLSPGSFAVVPITLGDSTITSSPRSVAALDLDGDGDMDLVSANELGDDLTVFLQEPGGSFPASPDQVLGGMDAPVSVAAADLDGDGDPDLVSANRDSDDLTVFLQLSPGSFAMDPLVLGDSATTDGPVSVVAVDLDADGDLDLVSANSDGDDLTIFHQLSPGSFAVPLTLGDSAMTDGPVSIAAIDLDADGDLDLVSANSDGDDLTVFLQLSPGSFAVPLTLGDSATTDGPVSVAAADLDGDGDLDLVSANELGFDLTAFFQLSPGSFGMAPLALASGGAFPTSVVAVDLDGDGDQDLVLANRVNPPPAPVPVRGNLTVFFGGR